MGHRQFLVLINKVGVGWIVDSSGMQTLSIPETDTEQILIKANRLSVDLWIILILFPVVLLFIFNTI